MATKDHAVKILVGFEQLAAELGLEGPKTCFWLEEYEATGDGGAKLVERVWLVRLSLRWRRSEHKARAVQLADELAEQVGEDVLVEFPSPL